MYALRTADLPLARCSSNKEDRDGAASAGLRGLDINFEENGLDLSLRQFTSKPAEVEVPPIKSDFDTPKNDAQGKTAVPIGSSTQLQPSSRQRKRLIKAPKQNRASSKRNAGKQVCDDISRRLRDPEKHHVHYTEDYPDPPTQPGPNNPPQQEQKSEAVTRKNQSEEGELKDRDTASVSPVVSANGADHEPPQSEPYKLQDPQHGTVLDYQDAPSDIKPKSKFKRGLARVKSISVILRGSGRTSRDSQPETDESCKGTTSEGSPAEDGPSISNHSECLAGDGLAKIDNVEVPRQAAPGQAPKKITTPLPSKGFLTDEAIQHDLVRFANAFRSRVAEKQLLKSKTLGSAASSSAIRGGSGGGNRGMGGMPLWMRDMNDRIRQLREAPEFQPFRRNYENHLDDGSTEYVEEMDYHSGRDGAIGPRGRGGWQDDRRGGRRGGGLGGGFRGLFGGRPRSPPGRFGDPMDMAQPGRGQPGMDRPGMGHPGMGPMGTRYPGMGAPGMRGQMVMGGFGMMPPVMGYPGMGGRGMFPGGAGGEDEVDRPGEEAEDLDPEEARFRRRLRVAEMFNDPEYAAYVTAQRAAQLNRNRQ